MKKILALTLAVSSTMLTAAAADDAAELMAPLHKFVDAFNKGDNAGAKAACADATSVIDEFAPYQWSGPGACQKWMDDFDADAKKNEITPDVVKLGTPVHANVNGDRGYVVVPASYTFKDHGKPAEETGATMTVTLQKVASGWTITGWAWTKGK